MRLFDIVPQEFFVLFTLEKKSKYIDVLNLLWSNYKEKNGEMTKSEAISYIVSDFCDDISELLNEEEIIQSERNLKGYATTVFNKIRKYKWIEEVHSPKEMEIYINIPSYASKTIKLINEIVKPDYDKSLNYTTNVYLNIDRIGAKDEVDYFVFLENAHQNTEDFIDVLNETFDYMKRHYELLLKQATIDSVLSQHFENYVNEIVQERFHPLMTHKNTLRYKQRILEKISDIEYNQETIDVLVRELMTKYHESSRETAEDKILKMLNFIKSQYENIDSIRDRLKTVHAQYVRVTREKIFYLSSRDENLLDNIYFVLQFAKSDEGTFDHIAQRHIELRENKELSMGSLKLKRNKRHKHFDESKTVVKNEKTDMTAHKESLLKRQREKTKKYPKYSKKTIETFIETMLKINEPYNTKDLDIPSLKTYILLICSINYCSQPNAKYEAEITDRMVQKENFSIQEVIIRRKCHR